MSRAQIFEGIVAALNADAALIPGILGPRTVTNQRLYRQFPQTQSILSSYEPEGGEGWIVIEEPPAGLHSGTDQYESAVDIVQVNMHVFATRYSLAEDAIDVLDSLYHWTVPQQRDIQYGERYLLMSRRFQNEEKYSTETKLYIKKASFLMQFILATLPA